MGGLRPGDAVGVIEAGDSIYVATLPTGPIVVLEGVAALIWIEACEGDRETIADRVASATDAPAEVIREHVESFVADLVARGLLR
jgi:hypothetical protein